jgi:WD40 repeat protein/serine/threonine protein kinase
MPPLDADQDLLLGILALRNDLIGQVDFNLAFQCWSKDTSRRLARVLVECGALSEEDLAILEGLTRRHIEKHGGDLARCLVGIGAAPIIAAVLRQGADPVLTTGSAGVGSNGGGADRPGRSEGPATLMPPLPEATFLGAVRGSTPWSPPGEPDIAGSRFQVLRTYAEGGVGLVSVALDTELHREVALKGIRPELADDPRNRARFLQEAEITGRLEHPGVVPIYGLGADVMGRPFYAMRLVHGESLKDAIEQFHGDARRASRPAPDRALELRRLLTRFVTVCEVVAYAHSRGVIHRDLKPANILLGPYGETLVVDWGLAKAIGGDGPQAVESADVPVRPQSAPANGGSVTLAGTVVGTPAYMSPEQAEGSVESSGPASDVYSLGATLYHLLVGRPPFWDSDPETILGRVRRGELTPPRSANPAISPSLDAMCRKAMALRPEDRYGSARGLAEDIERWLADEPIPWVRAPWGERFSRWERRNRALIRAGAASLVLVAGVSLVAAILINASRQDEHEHRLEALRQKAMADDRRAEALRQKAMADDQRRRAEERSLEVQRLSAEMVLDEGLTMCEQGDIARGMLHLGRSLELLPRDSPQLERLIRTCLGGWADRLITLRAYLSTGGKARAVFSPDSTRVVTASDDRTARVWDAATGRPLSPPLPHDHEVNVAAFSPDGTRVITASDDRTARIWEVATGRLVTPPLVHKNEVNAASFDHGGTRVVTASGDFTARVWDATTGRPLTPPITHGGEVHMAAFSPDGSRIATASRDATARVWDAATGRPRTGPLRHGDRVTMLAFSPDGARVVTASVDGTARVWDAESGEPLGPPLTHQSRVNRAAFSPDGKMLVTASDDFTARVWEAATGRSLTTPLMHRGGVVGAAFSHDGTLVATASQDYTARVWEVATGHPRGSPMEHRDWVYSAEFSPDDRRILTSSRDFAARIWDLGPLPAAHPILQHPGPVQAAAYAADGARIVTACGDGNLRVWDATDGRPIGPMIPHRGVARMVAFSPDGRRILSADGDRTARVWDATTGRPLVAAVGHSAQLNSSAFSPDGGRIVTTSADGTARVWEAATGRMLEPFLTHRKWVWTAFFSPDGSRIVTACGDHMARIWDAETRRALGAPLVHNSEVWWAAYNPDGTRIVTAGQENVARVWDALTGKLLGPTAEHRGVIHTAMFSPDGARIVTASNDRTARVWDVSSGRPLGPPLEHGEAVRWAGFSPDGARILTASGDRRASVWSLPRPLDIEPQRIADWLGGRTGLALGERGGIVVLDDAAWGAARARLGTPSSGLKSPVRPAATPPSSGAGDR